MCCNSTCVPSALLMGGVFQANRGFVESTALGEFFGIVTEISKLLRRSGSGLSSYSRTTFSVKARLKLTIAITIKATKPMKMNCMAVNGIKHSTKAKPNCFCFHLHFTEID